VLLSIYEMYFFFLDTDFRGERATVRNVLYIEYDLRKNKIVILFFSNRLIFTS
jgi:hypothetical protein